MISLIKLRDRNFTACGSSWTTSSIKHRIGWFYVVVVHWTSKKCTKERDARAELLSFAHKTNCFLTLLLSSSSSLLKVPNVVAGNKLPNVGVVLSFCYQERAYTPSIKKEPC